jgi:hypothetical protein
MEPRIAALAATVLARPVPALRVFRLGWGVFPRIPVKARADVAVINGIARNLKENLKTSLKDM